MNRVTCQYVEDNKCKTCLTSIVYGKKNLSYLLFTARVHFCVSVTFLPVNTRRHIIRNHPVVSSNVRN